MWSLSCNLLVFQFFHGYVMPRRIYVWLWTVEVVERLHLTVRISQTCKSDLAGRLRHTQRSPCSSGRGIDVRRGMLGLSHIMQGSSYSLLSSTLCKRPSIRVKRSGLWPSRFLLKTYRSVTDRTWSLSGSLVLTSNSAFEILWNYSLCRLTKSSSALKIKCWWRRLC